MCNENKTWGDGNQHDSVGDDFYWDADEGDEDEGVNNELELESDADSDSDSLDSTEREMCNLITFREQQEQREATKKQGGNTEKRRGAGSKPVTRQSFAPRRSQRGKV